MTQQNKNSGFVNLKKIHDIQVGGSVQALIRDLRSTRIQLDHVVSEVKSLLQSKNSKKVDEKVVEKVVEPTVEEKQKTVFENKQDFSAKDGRFEKRDFKKQPFSKEQPRQFNKDGKTFEQRKQFNGQQFNRPFNKEGQKPGSGFASSKGNNFRSFAAPDIVIPENNRRYDNKNKAQNRDLDEKKQPTKRNQQQKCFSQ